MPTGSIKFISANCKRCGTSFNYRYKASKRSQVFCSRSCSNKEVKRNRSEKDLLSSWTKTIGSEAADEKLQRLKLSKSESATRNNTGKNHSDITKRKISESCQGNKNVLKGRTYLEYYGLERAKQLSEEHSRKLKEGYASGRIKPSVRTKSAPTYKNVKLRSMLELRVIRFLEESENLCFNDSLFYEHSAAHVTWHDSTGARHTYIPDLYVPSAELVIEVKPQRFVDSPTEEMMKKKDAVLREGYKFEYYTERTITCRLTIQKVA